MIPSLCSTRLVSDLRARSFLTFMQDTRGGSGICPTLSDCRIFLRLRFSFCSKCGFPCSLTWINSPSAYYHTMILHLFRPFLKVDLTNSKISPRDICTSCARNVGSLIGTYRQIYGLRRVPLIATHILLSTSIIHLLNLPNPSSGQDLTLSITCLREISANHRCAIRSLHIVMALSQQWNVHLPSEVAQIAFESSPEIPTNLPDPQGYGNTLTHLFSVPDRSQQPGIIHAKDMANGFPFSAIVNSPSPCATPADMFWSPFPDHSVPLQAHQQNGPMDISAMLDVPNNDWDQLSRDGFRLAKFRDPITGIPAYDHIDGQWA